MNPRRLSTLLLVALLAACAGTPAPGDPGYLYNLAGPYTGQFSVEGQALPATLELETAPGGVVTGVFRIEMMGIEGALEGEIVGDRLTFAASYYNPGSGCEGVTAAEGVITENGASLEGRIEATECGQYLTGTFSFSR